MVPGNQGPLGPPAFQHHLGRFGCDNPMYDLALLIGDVEEDLVVRISPHKFCNRSLQSNHSAHVIQVRHAVVRKDCGGNHKKADSHHDHDDQVARHIALHVTLRFVNFWQDATTGRPIASSCLGCWEFRPSTGHDSGISQQQLLALSCRHIELSIYKETHEKTI